MKQNNAKRLTYEIVVRGHLDDGYAGWFEGMTLAQEEEGVTTMCGSVTDQAALHGLLSRIRDLGLVLLSLRCVPQSEAAPER